MATKTMNLLEFDDKLKFQYELPQQQREIFEPMANLQNWQNLEDLPVARKHSSDLSTQFSSQNLILKKNKYDPSLEVQGHRGAGPKHNTLEAFQMAIDLGLDAVELDVWLSNDKQLAVYHGEGDFGLIQYGDEKVQVVNLDMDQIQNLNFYYKNQEIRVIEQDQLDQNISQLSNESFQQSQLNVQQQGEDNLHINTRIPSLREVLQLCKNKIRCNIELKGGKDEKYLVYSVLDLVNELGMEDQIELSSFQHRYYDMAISYINEKRLEQVLEECPDAKQIKEINYPKFGFLVEFPKDIGQDFINKFQSQQYGKNKGNTINFPGEFLDCQVAIQNLKILKEQYGLNLTTWFSYDRKESQEVYDNLRNIGVNCIITNEPELINQYRTFQP